MKSVEPLDHLLRQALSPSEEPDEAVNQSILQHIQKERNTMKSIRSKRLSVALIAAVLTLTLSITAFAATQLFSSKEVAQELQLPALAKAFEDESAIEVNETVLSGDYAFTLHGIVSGKGLNELGDSTQGINADRTYAVVSIAKQDGSAIPSSQDETYGEVPFFVSPLVKGLKPWQVNIATMHGAYSEIVRDGVLYRLIECDSIEMFADRGLYLAISTSTFYDNQAFDYVEETGELALKENYSGAHALFTLPLDTALANPEQADKYLKELLSEPSTTTPASDDEHQQEVNDLYEKAIANGELIPESVREVDYDAEGRILYEYEGSKVNLSPELLFEEGQVGLSDAFTLSEGNGTITVIQFIRDEAGVITGQAIIWEQP